MTAVGRVIPVVGGGFDGALLAVECLPSLNGVFI